MTDPEGGFYAAEDADSEGREGTFYLWEPQETTGLLGTKNARIFDEYYGVTASGNFEHGKSILNVTESVAEVARQFKMTPAGLNDLLAGARAKMLANRSTRPRPHRDDKIITAWNGLMISSMAFGGAVMDRPKYIEAAEKAAEFVLSKLRGDGRLKRYYRSGRAVGAAFLDDYAFMVAGLIDLYEATFDPKWLVEARNLAHQMIDLFGDEQNAAFYLTAGDSERLIVRTTPDYDGAVPSGNSVAALVLLRLGLLTMDEDIRGRADSLLNAFSARLARSPVSLSAMLAALETAVPKHKGNLPDDSRKANKGTN